MNDFDELPEPVAVELTRLLTEWASTHRLSDADAASIRASVLGAEASEHTLDAEWLWSLLRPVTALLDQSVTGHYHGFRGWPLSGDDERGTSRVPYLQLA